MVTAVLPPVALEDLQPLLEGVLRAETGPGARQEALRRGAVDADLPLLAAALAAVRALEVQVFR
jgi:hypothetical protein